MVTYVEGRFCPVICSVHFLVSWGFQMSSIQQRLATATDTRLAVVINAAVNLKAQLRELNELRERVKKELPSAPDSER